MSGNLFGLIASRMPGREAVFLETDEGRVLTYGGLLEATARYARALEGLGVAPGDRVAVQVEKSPEALILYLACLRAGAIYLPLNTAYTLPEVDYFVGDAEPRLVVVGSGRREEAEALPGLPHGAHVVTMDADGTGTLADRAAREAPSFTDVAREPHDLAAILYTSGTTGRSKGAMLSHDNLASNAEVLREAWHFTGEDVLLHALPIYHTHGLFVATNTILLAGASMLFMPRFDADTVMRLLPRATTMMGVPTFYVRLLQDRRLDKAATEHMRLFVSGSAPLLAETHREWRDRTGHAILERYGMTETNMNTSNPYDGERVAGTVGPPLPGVSLRIADPETGAGTAAGRDRRHRGEGPQRLPRLLAHAGEDGGRVPQGRLLHHRRPRPRRRARLRDDHRAQQGPRHHRRLQRVPQGGRDGDRRHSGRGGERGLRRAAS